ncbi:MAG TPA: ABC transporter permease [Candidatus Limnocylindrales bacterium]|jgi:ABC-2 type transport system permease protein
MTTAATTPARSLDFDARRADGNGLIDSTRAFGTAAKLGWQMEANWTDPLLFFIYSVAKPIASALILVVMLTVIAGPGASEARAFLIVGSALWAFVMSGVAGLAWSVLDDRERYRMLKYIYVSPSDLRIVLMGRGVARIAIGAMGAVIVLAFGVLFLGVPFSLAAVDWLILSVDLVLGLTAIVAIGIMLAAVCLQTRQESWSYPEAVAGALFLVVAAVFPLSVLPLPVQGIGLLVPLTWWLEGVRQAAFPGSPTGIGGEGSLWLQLTGSQAPDATTIVLVLLATTLVVTLAALVVFRWSEARAKDRGLIDQTTGS